MYAEIQYDIDYSARKIYYHDFNYMTMCVYRWIGRYVRQNAD